MKQELVKGVSLIITAALISATAGYTATQVMQNWKEVSLQQAKNQAIHDCGTVSSFTVEEMDALTGKKSVSQQPNEKVYQTCISTKGYELK